MDLLDFQNLQSSISLIEAALRITSAVLSAFVLAAFYRYTHTGISYSANFGFSIIVCGLLAAGIIITVGENIARAFALVGALAIIRYRTVIKDPKDLSYIFAALVIGMALGTGLYAIAFMIETVFIAIALVVRFTGGLAIVEDFNAMLRIKGDQHLTLHSLETVLLDELKYFQILTYENSPSLETTSAVIEARVTDSPQISRLVSKMQDVPGFVDISFISGNNSVTY